MKPDAFSPLTAEEASFLLIEVERFDPRWTLILPYVPDTERARWLAILAFAAEVEAIPARVSNAMLGEIRRQWWREALTEVFGDEEPRKHPVVQALARVASDAGDLRRALEAMIEGLGPFFEPPTAFGLEARLEERERVDRGLLEALTGSPVDQLAVKALGLSVLGPVQASTRLVANEDGTEGMRARFARLLGSEPGLGKALATEIETTRRAIRKRKEPQPLPVHLLALVRTRKDGSAAMVANPFAQRLAVLRATLTGRP